MESTTHQLRPFQSEDVDWFVTHHRAMMLYEMRLGKTVVSVNVISRLRTGINVIICPTNALYVWRDHILDWMPALNVPQEALDVRIILDDKIGRYASWILPRTKQYTFYITTYDSFIRDVKDGTIYKYVPKIDMLITDEAKRMNSRKTKAFQTVLQVAYQCAATNILFLEGTPVKKGPMDLWTYFHMINRKTFGSYWQFVMKFYEVVDGMWGGKEIIGLDHSKKKEWSDLLQRHARVRFRKDVRPEMPPKQRSIIHVDMDPEQQSLYDKIDTNQFVWLDEEKMIIAPTSLELSIRLRQILICPRVLDNRLGLGAAFNNLLEKLDEATIPEEKQVVIFCPFTRPFVFFSAELQRRGYEVSILQGGIGPEAQKTEIARFREKRGICLCSIRYAEAFSLEPATASYFIGAEWNPNWNRQAEDRLVPQSGVEPIQAFYYAYNASVDDGIVRRLNHLQNIIDATMTATPQPQPQPASPNLLGPIDSS